MTLRGFLERHMEAAFIIVVLVVVSAVFHWIPYKFAFLNFFYLPVLAASVLLGARRAVLSSVMCVLLVILYYLWAWGKDCMASPTCWQALPRTVLAQYPETLLTLAMWGGFLILTGGVLGRLHETMVKSEKRVRDLNEGLERQTAEQQKLNAALKATTSELNKKADQLEEKNLLVENLKQQAEKTLYSTMDATVARLMIQGRLRQEKRAVSLLFCDLVSFSPDMREHRPEVVLEDLNRFYEVVEQVIENYHGHIDKYMGEGVMCEFGAPVDYERHSLQAVLAGVKVQEQFQEMNMPFRLRVGVASGEAVLGLVGSRRRSYTALGDVVNLAARLKEICEPGSLYMDEATRDAAKMFVELEQIRNPVAGRRNEDAQLRGMIEQKEKQLERAPQDAELLFTVGMLYYHMREATRALDYFRRAMELKPEDNDIKVAYADASVRRDEYERIPIRGIAQKQAIFKALGLKNPLLNRDRFPKTFYDRFREVEGMVEIPDNVTLPTESVDGTIGHSKCVAIVSFALADHLGLPEELKKDLLVAGRLQDVGKSAVWHHTLNRRGGLSDQEKKDLEAHVEESISIAKRTGYDKPGVLQIIGGHHEVMNGTGFPKGIKGEAIPIGARISGVADVFCALTAWRPFRPAWELRVALGELRKGADTGKYDPKVINALCELMEYWGSQVKPKVKT